MILNDKTDDSSHFHQLAGFAYGCLSELSQLVHDVFTIDFGQYLNEPRFESMVISVSATSEHSFKSQMFKKTPTAFFSSSPIIGTLLLGSKATEALLQNSGSAGNSCWVARYQRIMAYLCKADTHTCSWGSTRPAVLYLTRNGKTGAAFQLAAASLGICSVVSHAESNNAYDPRHFAVQIKKRFDEDKTVFLAHHMAMLALSWEHCPDVYQDSFPYHDSFRSKQDSIVKRMFQLSKETIKDLAKGNSYFSGLYRGYEILINPNDQDRTDRPSLMINEASQNNALDKMQRFEQLMHLIGTDFTTRLLSFLTDAEAMFLTDICIPDSLRNCGKRWLG